MILYGDRYWDSPYFFSVFVALQEKRIAFEVETLDLDRGEQRAAGYRDKSLTGRIPCIDRDGFVLSESLAIIDYLDEAFPAPAHPRVLPESLEQRARARQLLGWVRSDLLALREERPTTTMFFARATTPMSANARTAADKLLRIADAVIPPGEGNLFGTWSIADADLAFMLHRLIANDEAVPERVRAYAVAQWQRPSVRAFVERDRPRPAR
jgi:glutathione S-transferase